MGMATHIKVAPEAYNHPEFNMNYNMIEHSSILVITR